MKKILFALVIICCLSGCKTPSKPPVQIWWGTKGDEVAWEKAREVMQNYNWVVLSTDQVN